MFLAPKRLPLVLPGALALLALSACTGGGGGGQNLGQILPSIGAEIVLENATITLDKASVRLLLTPAELRSLADAVDKSGGGGGDGGGSDGGGGPSK